MMEMYEISSKVLETLAIYRLPNYANLQEVKEVKKEEEARLHMQQAKVQR
jgi:hypothetical protein